MGGVDTVRGIAYQQAQAVLVALDVLDREAVAAIRVEGSDDIVDIELLGVDGRILHGSQLKTRADPYTWSKAELFGVLRRWASTEGSDGATFEFVTNGQLGPSALELHLALDQAHLGMPERLEELLTGTPDGPLLETLKRTRVRLDPSSIAALLSRAYMQVAAIIPDVRSVADAHERAVPIVDSLFGLLTVRASEADPDARVVTRAELAEIVGVDADRLHSSRWSDSMKRHCIEVAVAAAPELVTPKLRRLDGAVVAEQDEEGTATLLRLEGAPATISGRTGEGKTTALQWLRRVGAERGRLMLVVHAETFVPGRLASLAADAISDHLNRVVPASAGRAALMDRDVTLAIDGASEVPDEVRVELARDIAAMALSGAGARLLLVGRDVASLRSMLPSSVTPESLVLETFGRDQRAELVQRRLAAEPGTGQDARSDDRAVQTLVAQSEAALGEGVGNPLLLLMAVDLLLSGVSFGDRATLYAEFLQLLVARSGGTQIVATSRVLGTVYAELLDGGRRYADPYEWASLVANASKALSVPGYAIQPEQVSETARRCGLVTPIGYTQVLAPIHDSFADYLAGVAHAAGVPLPTRPRSSDEQRLLFTAEIAGVDQLLASAVAEYLPFLTVRLSALDRRSEDDSPVEEVEHLLGHLLPEGTSTSVLIGREPSGRMVAARTDGESRTLNSTEAASLVTTHDVVVTNGGPLAVAVRLWRQHLVEVMSLPRGLGSPRPTTIEGACQLLERHERDAAAAIGELVEKLAPLGASALVRQRLGPLGLTAVVEPAEDAWSEGFGVRYERTTDEVVIRSEARADSDSSREMRGSATLGSFLDTPPSQSAIERVRSSLNALTVPRWL